MNRVEFQNQLSNISIPVNTNIIEECKQIVNITSENDGGKYGNRSLLIAIEELSELQKEITKKLRNKKDHIGILEELADVQIIIYELMAICEISDSDLKKAMMVKILNFAKKQDIT